MLFLLALIFHGYFKLPVVYSVVESSHYHHLGCGDQFSIKNKSRLPQPFYPLRRNTHALTVIAEWSPVCGHGAVTGEALPQLQTHSLVVAGVLCAGGAGTCRDSILTRCLLSIF